MYIRTRQKLQGGGILCISFCIAAFVFMVHHANSELILQSAQIGKLLQGIAEGNLIIRDLAVYGPNPTTEVQWVAHQRKLKITLESLFARGSLGPEIMAPVKKNILILDRLFVEVQTSFGQIKQVSSPTDTWQLHLLGQVHLASGSLFTGIQGLEIAIDERILSQEREGGLFVLIALLLLLGIYALSLMVVERQILGPIYELQLALKELSTVDFKIKPQIHRNDEIGDLYLAFYSMVEEVREAVSSLEQEVNLRQEVARELLFSNKELESFAHIVSHDLQEPLNTISRFLQLLEANNKDKLDENSKEHMAFIMDAATRMRQLILDLLQLSRLGKGDLKLQEVDCTKIVEEVCLDLHFLIEESATQIHIDPFPLLKGSKKLLGQVFRNLISNAIKYNNHPRPVIRIRCERLAQGHAITVEDNGIGMRELDLKEIFKPFHRLHSCGAYPGTGIGLAICQKVITLHGGKIWCRSTEGKGSRFIFTIPGNFDDELKEFKKAKCPAPLNTGSSPA
jgi:signal transduction histidine kinase